jgi:hypothetical protein
MVRLDDILEDKQNYNFLTIDVQGYELEVLKGSRETLKNINYILTEVNRDELYENCARVEQLDEFLGRFNFQRNDVKKYIGFMLNEDPDYGVRLQKWVQEGNISNEDFIEQVADKSENNFMYLRYVLPDIAKGYYSDLSLKKLPDGLQDYYQQHWVRMGMEDKPQKNKVIILFILVESRTLPTLEMIAEFAQQDVDDVEYVLKKEWVEFLSKQEVGGEICYSIYHASFLIFLRGKGSWIVPAGCLRK